MKIAARFAAPALAVLAIPVAASAQNPMGSSQPPQLSVQAQHFLNLLASEDASEINLARLALKKSANPQVQQYAKTKILAADPSMERGAVALAQQNHVPIDASPSSTASAEFYYLSKLSGKAFDKAYMGYEDQKQTADLIMVKDEVNAAKNPQLRSFVQKEEVPVREAAQSAQQLDQAIGS